MRLVVNGSDITQFVRKHVFVNWQFSDSPGSLAYSPPTDIELAIPPKSTLEPTNPSSPLSVPNAIVSLEIDDYVFSGVLKSAIRSTPSVVILNISDSIQSRLQFQNVIGSWEGTPAQIARYILLSYGIITNSNTFSTCVSAQTEAGLQFRYQVGIEDEKSLQDSLDELAKAGWMRIAIWNGIAYAIQGIPTIPQLALPGFTIEASDLWGLPSERELSGTQTSGGNVKWAASTVIVARTNSNLGEFNQDYSQFPAILDNPSGANYLISANSRPPRKSFELPVNLSFARNFMPGDWIMVLPGIFDEFSTICQLVGMQIESNLKAKLTVEIAGKVA